MVLASSVSTCTPLSLRFGRALELQRLHHLDCLVRSPASLEGRSEQGSQRAQRDCPLVASRGEHEVSAARPERHYDVTLAPKSKSPMRSGKVKYKCFVLSVADRRQMQGVELWLGRPLHQLRHLIRWMDHVGPLHAAEFRCPRHQPKLASHGKSSLSRKGSDNSQANRCYTDNCIVRDLFLPPQP